jgi:carbamoyl-phosphate synthase L subunit-like protein
MKPSVLVATTCRWFPTARLAMALAKAGFTVGTVCPSQHPLSKISAIQEMYAYRGLAPLASFAAAIAAMKPDLIIPADDSAARHLHRLHGREGQHGARPLSALIERSLGTPESFPVVNARSAFMQLAKESDVRVAEMQVITSTDELRKWIARVGLPTVLKADGTSGGDGVRIVHTLEDAERAFQDLQAPPLLARAAKRAIVDQDQTLLLPSLLRRRSVVNAQTFVSGSEATSTVACWQGIVLASLHFEVLQKADSAGHATVVRLIEHSEMSNTAETMVHELNLSGLLGFDFMLEAHTGNAYLLEINPRATQVGHLMLGPGRDLPAALCAAVSGDPLRAHPAVTENDTISLFPQEWIRDPASEFLRSSYHDVPWDEPELVRACVRAGRKQRAWYSDQNPNQVLAATSPIQEHK